MLLPLNPILKIESILKVDLMGNMTRDLKGQKYQRSEVVAKKETKLFWAFVQGVHRCDFVKIRSAVYVCALDT